MHILDIALNCPLIQIGHFQLKSFFFFFFEVSVMSFFVWLLCYCLHIVSTILSIRCFHPHSTESGEVMLLWVEKFLILRYVETQ